jgi:hypothetical protein
VAAGFFDVDVLASVAGEDCRWRMPVVGSGDADGVQRSIVEHSAEIAHLLRAAACLFFNPVRGFGGRPSVHITNSPDHTSGDGQKTLQMCLASVQPHHSHGHLIAGLC